jgi:glycerate-2-kinase
LSSHGCKSGRKIALDIIEKTLNEINPYNEVLENIRFQDNILAVDTELETITFDLKKINNIFVLGGGKGSLLSALALNKVLGDKITESIITVKGIESQKIDKIDIIKTGHPLPDDGSIKAAKEIIRIANLATENDLVFFIGSSGTSSMISLPVESVSLKDMQILYNLLLNNINNIQEINCVRKHISLISGGRLGQYISPGIILNFQPGNKKEQFKTMPWPDLIWEDPTTFQDAIFVLKKYHIWEDTPISIKKHLSEGVEGKQQETVKNIGPLKVYNIPMSYRYSACIAAKRIAEELGYNAMILSTMLEGESKEVGIALASIAKDIVKFNHPIKPPCVLIAGGETSVKVTNKDGKGGRNQEFVLGLAGNISGYNITVAAIDSEGTDGPTQVAGGIADGGTAKTCLEKNIDLFGQLNKNNSFYVLDSLQDHIITGPTNVAVQSIKIVVVQ